jgi:hypothetical protein
VRDIRVKLGVGRRDCVIGGIRLTRYQLRGVDDDDMALFEMLH